MRLVPTFLLAAAVIFAIPAAEAQTSTANRTLQLRQLLSEEYSARRAQIEQFKAALAALQSKFSTLNAARAVLDAQNPLAGMLQQEIEGVTAEVARLQQGIEAREATLPTIAATLNLLNSEATGGASGLNTSSPQPIQQAQQQE